MHRYKYKNGQTQRENFRTASKSYSNDMKYILSNNKFSVGLQTYGYVIEILNRKIQSGAAGRYSRDPSFTILQCWKVL